MDELKINQHVDNIVMPENLRVGLMIAEHRKMCEEAVTVCNGGRC